MFSRGRRSLSARRAAWCLGTVAAAALSVSAAAALPAQLDRSSIPLPTQQQGQAAAPNLESLLNPNHPIETHLPGAVSDREDVAVKLADDGALAAVSVVQRLVVHGLGDFSFKIPGPAQDVTALPSSENPPGLRKGSVLWEGFSDGKKILAARMPLFPDREARRLPVNVAIAATIGGRPISAGDAQSGPLDMTVTFSNQSAQPVAIERAQAKPSIVAPILDRTIASLRRDRVPTPGARGLPSSIPIVHPGPSTSEQIEAPFAITGRLIFPTSAIDVSSVTGGNIATRGGQTIVRFGSQLGGGSPMSATVHVTGDAIDLTRPRLVVSGHSALPRPGWVAPRGGGTWAAAAARGRVSGSTIVTKLLETMWRVARLRQFDAYLGNPDPTGPATTSYSFAFASAPHVAAPSGPALKKGSLTLTLTGLLALLLLLCDAIYLWALS